MFNFSVGSSRRRKDKGRSKTLPNNVFDLKLFKPSNSPSEQMVSRVLCAELIAAPDHKPVIFIFFLCFFFYLVQGFGYCLLVSCLICLFYGIFEMDEP